MCILEHKNHIESIQSIEEVLEKNKDFFTSFQVDSIIQNI